MSLNYGNENGNGEVNLSRVSDTSLIEFCIYLLWQLREGERGKGTCMV